MNTNRPIAMAADLLLPLAVVAVVALMVLPLPPALLDVLLMSNIAFALALLVSAAYLAQPERFTSLPSILLLSTLFRLSLNVSTTRQLLAHGTAPDVVGAFGNFVASGNIVVGLVVFAIITLVQFLVIAKGAERVAEVAARFTLDALPGKQMSIDADVRSGTLSPSEAKQRRLELHREARLYGSMDGAMKFVKGDAIAGILITLINLFAGLVLGVSQQGLSFQAAVQKYSVFTIGDGLVSQLPALLVAVAAGVAVTRVSDGGRDNLGSDIVRQLGDEPKGLLIVSLVLTVIGMMPGFPFMIFLCGGALFLFWSLRVVFVQASKRREDAIAEFRPLLASKIILRLTQSAAMGLQQERSLPQLLREVRIRCFNTLGILIPEPQFEISAEIDGLAEIMINGFKVESLKDSDRHSFSASLAAVFERVVLQRREELLDDTHTRMLLEVHRPVAEDLINAIVPEAISITALTTLLKSLVREEVSIREMPSILQAITEYQLRVSKPQAYRLSTGAELDGAPPDLLAAVRYSLRQSILAPLVNLDILEAWVLPRQVEQLFARLAEAQAPIAPAILDELEHGLGMLAGDGRKVLLVCAAVRSLLARIVSRIHGNISVVAVEEVTDDLRINILGEIPLPSLGKVDPLVRLSEAA